MIQHAENFRDKRRKVNCAALAEAVAAEYGLYENQFDYTIPGWVFDIAAGVQTDIAGRMGGAVPPEVSSTASERVAKAAPDIARRFFKLLRPGS